MGKKILITGASGFLGKPLVEKLLNAGEEVISISGKDGDISSPSILHDFRPDDIKHVYHLAAKTYVPDSWDNPLEFFKTNCIGTLNVLEFCKTAKTRLTFVSAYIYGNVTTMPISADTPPEPKNPYALSKYLSEEICKFYSDRYGIPVNIYRIFNLYGPGQNARFIIPIIINQALHDNEIVVKDLSPKRDYVFLDDVLNALLKSRNYIHGYQVFNIGSGQSFSVEEIINKVLNILKISKPIRSENQLRIQEIQDTVADISKAKNELKWQPVVPIEKGLEYTIQYYRNTPVLF